MGGSHGGSVGEQDRDALCGWLDVSDGYSGVNKVGWMVCGEEVGCGAGIGYYG